MDNRASNFAIIMCFDITFVYYFAVPGMLEETLEYLEKEKVLMVFFFF